MKVIVVGAGWAGVSAAYEASIKGATVTLLERTDMILGTGLVGGIMRNNGRYTALEELKWMGMGDFISAIDQTSIHQNIDFPGHKHASLYDVSKIEQVIRHLLEAVGIQIQTRSRIHKVEMVEQTLMAVIDDQGNRYEADVFIDTTGTGGPMNQCMKYGNGCAMCILRCPTFQGRVSLAGLCKIEELQAKKKDGSIGAMSGSCKISKDSIAPSLISELEKKGYLLVPLNQDMIEDHLDEKACQQYALPEYKDNLVILDSGHAKLMSPYYPLSKLRQIKGFEQARYIDPYAGGIGNSMRFFAIVPHDNTMQVKGMNNLFCAGEKAGLVGHTEAIITGVLAGYNAVKFMKQEGLLTIPRTTLIGEAIAYTNEQIDTPNGITKKYTASGSVLFDHLKECQLYTIDENEISTRIEDHQLLDIFY